MGPEIASQHLAHVLLSRHFRSGIHNPDGLHLYCVPVRSGQEARCFGMDCHRGHQLHLGQWLDLLS